MKLTLQTHPTPGVQGVRLMNRAPHSHEGADPVELASHITHKNKGDLQSCEL